MRRADSFPEVSSLPPCGRYLVTHVGEPGPRALDLCGLGTRRLQQSRLADAEIECVRPDGPSPGQWVGLAGMAEATRDWLNTWENSRAAVDEYRELDAERVLVL